MRIRNRRRATPSRPLNFARDVRPILSDNCFACHGPDDQKRKAKLRLDTREGAFAKLEGGEPVIVPGKPDESDLIDRIENDDPELRMPPKKSGKQLTAEQVAVLRRWVEQGATWTAHWSFEPPRKPALPAVKNLAWPITEVDRFILARLESEGLSPAPEADKTTLIRRVSLDLTGLPPTLGEVDAFLADPSRGAYEKVVDRLLDSPRYGEHMARFWLDAARYGDTHGLHLDNYREIWPYRDWVIRAFNSNKPFDRFVIEQLAGDLLPNPTPDQIVATGYNRCHVSTNEGGSIEEEVYVRNIVDQVDTNGTVFLGLTTGCARCHDHKYDPIRMKDYYQLFAFFNNIDGPAMDGNVARWAPIAQMPTPRQAEALQAATTQIASLQQAIAIEAAQAASAYDPKADANESETAKWADFVWIDDALPAGASPQGDGPWDFVAKPDHPVYSGRLALRNRAEGLNQRFFDNAANTLKVGAGDTLFAYVYIDPKHPPRELMIQWHTKGGWTHRAYWGDNVIDWGKDGTPDGWPAAACPPRQVGAAGGTGGQARDGAGHGDRRLGVYSIRRHDLLGQGRHPDRNSPGRPALRFLHGLDSGPARQCRRGLARELEEDRQGRASQADRGPDQGAPRLFLRACVFQDGRDLRAVAIQAGRGRAEAEEARRANPHDPGLS